MDGIILDRGLFEKILDSLPFKFYIVDRELNILFWNQKGAEGPYAVSKEDAVGRSLKEVLSLNKDKVISTKDITVIEMEFKEVFESGRELHSENVSILIDGDKRYYRVTKSPISLFGGEVTHVATVIEEITGKRQLEAQLITREKLAYLGQMAAGLAHQINNPLSTINVCVDALLRETKIKAFTDANTFRKFEKYLKIVSNEASRCNNIAGLQSRFGVSSGKPSRTDINALMSKVIDLVRVSKKFSSFHVETVFENNLPRAMVEECFLSQAFIALLCNAFEALDSKEDGIVRITTFSSNGKHGPDVRVAIEDTGGGIDAGILNNIFTPFFTTKGGDRTGLGLYLANEIVRENRGEMEVRSDIGSGSIFTVILPQRI